MKYVLLWLTTLAATPIISNIAVNTTPISVQDTVDANMYNMKKSNYGYDNTIQSIDNNVEYRLYVDTTKDTLTPTDNKIDFNLGYQPKNKWYDLELQVGTYKFDDFEVSSRSDLISKLGTKFSLSYYYAFNMWDSWAGWRFPNGKNNTLTKATSEVVLKTEATTNEVQYDKANSGTEAGRIQIRQEWEAKELKIFLRMSVWYNWAWGSVVNHASLTKFSLTDVSNGGSSEIKIGTKTAGVKDYQSMVPGTTSTLSLDTLFDYARDIYDTKNKEGWKTVLPLFATYSAAGPIICTNGWGYSAINLFSYVPLVEDLAVTMLTGSTSSGKLKLSVSTNGANIISNLYYVDIFETARWIADAQIPSIVAPISVTYVGVTMLAYMYLL